MEGAYDRLPTIPDAKTMDDTLYMGGTGGAFGLRFDLGHRVLRVGLLDAAEPIAILRARYRYIWGRIYYVDEAWAACALTPWGRDRLVPLQ